MQKKLVIANWKMHGGLPFIQNWAKEFTPPSNAAAAVCPPFPYLSAVRAALPPAVQVGAQNIAAAAEDGAHTGEVSARMAAEMGCSFTLVGHSERRALGETDADCAAKLAAAAAGGLRAVLCVGEDAAARKRGKAAESVAAQLEILPAEDAAIWQNLTIAYEPIWAIGSGLSPSAAEVAEMRQAIVAALMQKSAAFGGTIPVLYGGSVTPAAAQALCGEADGFLVGGASLRPHEFAEICRTMETQ